jgi:hypothetical protein
LITGKERKMRKVWVNFSNLKFYRNAADIAEASSEPFPGWELYVNGEDVRKVLLAAPFPPEYSHGGRFDRVAFFDAYVEWLRERRRALGHLYDTPHPV